MKGASRYIQRMNKKIQIYRIEYIIHNIHEAVNLHAYLAQASSNELKVTEFLGTPSAFISPYIPKAP